VLNQQSYGGEYMSRKLPTCNASDISKIIQAQYGALTTLKYVLQQKFPLFNILRIEKQSAIK